MRRSDEPGTGSRRRVRSARRGEPRGPTGVGRSGGRRARPARLLHLIAVLLLAAGFTGCEGRAGDGDRASDGVARAEETRAPDRGPDAPGGTARDRPSSPDPGERDPRSFDLARMGYTAGSSDAPIRVVEFSDFGCGYCRKFHIETYPALHREYVETGKVRWKYVPFVLGSFPNGREAAHAGECAIEQDGFPRMRRRLFEDQSQWRRSDRPVDVFVRLAEEEGLDAGRFRTCLEEGRRADRVRENVALGRRVGVRGTPTFVIQGYPLQGAQPVQVFRQIFERLLSAPPPGEDDTS